MCVSGAPAGGPGQAGSEEKTPNRRLSRSQRLSQSRLFREAFDEGRSFPGRFMVMWLRSGEGASLRLGVIASKRSFRKAVDRGRAKRLLREAYRLNRHRLAGDVDIVLVARYKLQGLSRQDAEEDLLRIAEKAGLLKNG